MSLRPSLFFLGLLGLVLPGRAAPEPTLYSSDQLVAELTRSLTHHFHLEGELQLELLRAWTPPQGAAGVWQLAIAEYPGMPSSNMLVRINLRADGKLVGDMPLLVHALLWRDAWFSRQPLRSGTTFDSGLLSSQRIDAFRERDALPARAGDDSYVFCRDLPEDRMLTWHDVARRPLVHRGQVVDVTAAEGRLLLTMKGLAMENGAKGDLITVRNLESRKDISALVVANDRVEVHF